MAACKKTNEGKNDAGGMKKLYKVSQYFLWKGNKNNNDVKKIMTKFPLEEL